MVNNSERALSTFCAIPEIYAEALQSQGTKVPDGWVEAIKSNPQKALQLVNSDKELKSAIIEIYNSNSEKIEELMKQIPSNKMGGKISDIIGKFQFGGKYRYKVNVDPTYSASVASPGDTLRTKIYPYTTREMQTYPNGNVRYTIFRENDTQHFWSPQSKPNLLQRAWFGSRTVPAEEAQNWEEIIKNHPEDPRNVLKRQGGGKNINSASGNMNIQSMNIPGFGTVNLLQQQPFLGQIDSTFTFMPEKRNTYSVPSGTYMKAFSPTKKTINYRGFDVGGFNNFEEGEVAKNHFNGIRKLWEFGKNKK